MPYYKKSSQIATLKDALEKQTVDQLKRLLERLPTKERPTHKAELVELIDRQLKGENLRQLWKQLNSLEQAAVSEAVYSRESVMDWERFKAKYGKLTDFEPMVRWDSTKPSLLNLFFFGDGVIPEELKATLKKFVPEPKVSRIRIVEELPTTIEQTWRSYDYEARIEKVQVTNVEVEVRLMEQAAQQDLLAVLRAIAAGKVAVSDKTGFPSAKTQTVLSELLVGGDFYLDPPKEERNEYELLVGSIRAFSWPLIVQVAGLVQLSGKKLTLSKAGQKALSAPLEDTIAAAWRKWLKSTLLDELRRIDPIKGQTGKGKRGLTAVAGRREAIADVLMDCPVNSWIAVDEFFRYMQASNKQFEVSRNPENLYICDPGYGNLYELRSWSILEMRYAMCFLFEYAATLGLIDVAYIHPEGSLRDFYDLWGADDLGFLSRYDGLLYFRLNPLGAYCLRLTADYTPAPLEMATVLRVLPNLEIAVTGEGLMAADRLVLEQYAIQVSDTVWRLERDKILSAYSEGHGVTEFEEFLTARSGNDLPDTVRQFFQDLRSRTESLRDRGTARLIECADPALAALIAHDSRSKNYCYLAGDRYLIVPLESETKFRTALQKIGYSLPK